MVPVGSHSCDRRLGKEKYAGEFLWQGSSVRGRCEEVRCDGKKQNGKPGLECGCADGYSGQPLFKSRSDHRVLQPGPSPSKYSDSGRFSDETCTPAECGIPNSIETGPDCRCADKFVGQITWEGIVPSGRCIPARCDFQHSNRKPGPECACAYGYQELWPIVQPFPQGELVGTCDPIPCTGENTNRQDGPGCGCQDGYDGTVQLGTRVLNDVTKLFSVSGSQPALSNFTAFIVDDCVPARCDVENTFGYGKACRCDDGYQGSVTWIGPNAIGACKPAHCNIENSDKTPGLGCKCLDGYDGSILADVAMLRPILEETFLGVRD